MTLALSRGTSVGPWDDSELGLDDDVHGRYARNTDSRHGLVRESAIVTESATLTVPAGASYRAVPAPGGAEPTTGVITLSGSAQGNRMRAALRIGINIFADSVSGGLWEDELVDATHDYLTTANEIAFFDGDIAIHQGLWGRYLRGKTPTVNGVEEFVIAGAAGPRWMVRLTMYGMALDDIALDIAREIMATLVVHRGHQAQMRGTTLPMALVEPDLN